MFFVIDNARLRQLIKLTREDRSRKKVSPRSAPFYRLEASGEHVAVEGRGIAAQLAATVYEPGVLFLRIARLAGLLETLADEPTLAIQVNRDGLHVANVRIGLEFDDMLLYTDPARAPRRHPQELLGPLPVFTGSNGPTSWGPLFELHGLVPNPLNDLPRSPAS